MQLKILKMTKYRVDVYKSNSVYDADIVLQLLSGYVERSKKGNVIP